MRNCIVSRARVLSVAAWFFLAATPVFAGPWTIPSGSTDILGNPLSFSYSNGGDLNGFFGDPTIFNDAFFFSTAFLANSTNGVPDQQVDTLSVDILANPGLRFSSVSVSASGSYLITTNGSVDVNAGLSLTENPGPGSLQRVFSDTLATSVPFPVTTPSQGTWTGSAMVDIGFVFPTPSNDIHIELSNDILAITGPGGSAEVNVQFQDLSIAFTLVPEPTSLVLMAFGGCVLVLRRRRQGIHSRV